MSKGTFPLVRSQERRAAIVLLINCSSSVLSCSSIRFAWGFICPCFRGGVQDVCLRCPEGSKWKVIPWPSRFAPPCASASPASPCSGPTRLGPPGPALHCRARGISISASLIYSCFRKIYRMTCFFCVLEIKNKRSCSGRTAPPIFRPAPPRPAPPRLALPRSDATRPAVLGPARPCPTPLRPARGMSGFLIRQARFT